MKVPCSRYLVRKTLVSVALSNRYENEVAGKVEFWGSGRRVSVPVVVNLWQSSSFFLIADGILSSS